jgi:peptidoglycan/LPS O-acetylase OafA/YrhL
MRLNCLEAARGLAAFAVVLFHMNGSASFHAELPFFPSLATAIHGVDFFFVLSGFIIYHVHRHDIGRPLAAWDFVAKRCIRLFPILWLIVLGTIALFAFAGRSISGFQVLTSLLLTPSQLEPLPDTVWTLRHEFIFYVAFVVLILDRRVGLALFAGWTAAVLAQLFFALSGRPIGGLASFFLSSYEIDFVLGAAVAAVGLPARGGRSILAGALTVTAALLWLGERLGMERLALNDYTSLAATAWVVALGIAFALVVLGLLGIERQTRVPRWLIGLGACSYELYLVHVPVQMVLMRIGLALHWPAPAILAVVALGPIPVALLLHRHFERPVSRWLRTRLLRRSGSTA